MGFGDLVQFPHVFKKEVDSINERRRKLGREKVVLESEPTTTEGITPQRPSEQTPLVGLALSGGGERSAAFCLGALQALDAAGVLPKVDYLSTVSGGGYIGSSLSACMTESKGKFPFPSKLREDEPPSLQHIRNHSNYLFPHGLIDVVHNLAIYLRGLATNVVLVLPFLLLAAALTIAAHPVSGKYWRTTVYGWDVSALRIIAFAILGLFAFLVAWGLLRSIPSMQGKADYPNRPTAIAGAFILIVLFMIFCMAQPFVLDAIIEQDQDSFFAKFIKFAVVILAPIAGVVSLASSKLGEIAKKAFEAKTKSGQLAGYVAQAAIYLAALVLPILLWICYLLLTYWGLCSGICDRPFAPVWLNDAAHWIPFGFELPLLVPVYIIVAALGLVLGYCLAPNANSLHPLYRDRLSTAFLFRPAETLPVPADPRQQPVLALIRPKLSKLSECHAPYHLINAALNVQNSKIANKRGRNADFFIFSRNYIGSKTTRYVATEDVEEAVPELDLATAMSASGAAASSNMGSATIKPLTPTLALLNVRLGFWMRNPIRLKERFSLNPFADLYFLYEMLGLLNEKRRSIYLTDGGHIENLGIYELLRRRCKVIIAVDAEADPNLTFSSFNKLVRHALIDLGTRIDLPWQEIADVNKETGQSIQEKADAEKKTGPHVAIGEILYPDQRCGVLVYVKSSMTGDENDYIFDYKRRYAAFPHETTLDQLFSEEQFEAYRALGFHATYGFFDRRHRFARRNIDAYPSVRDELAVLDGLFPIVEGGDPNWPRKHRTFASYLPPVAQ